jgi:hypothetical protein
MMKKLALLAAAGILYIAAPAAPASAQGFSFHIGDRGVQTGHPGFNRHHGYNRGPHWRHSRAHYGPRHHRHNKTYRGHRTKTIIVR